MEFFKGLYRDAAMEGVVQAKYNPKEGRFSAEEIAARFDDEITDAVDEYTWHYAEVYGLIYDDELYDMAYEITLDAVVKYWNIGFDTQMSDSERTNR